MVSFCNLIGSSKFEEVMVDRKYTENTWKRYQAPFPIFQAGPGDKANASALSDWLLREFQRYQWNAVFSNPGSNPAAATVCSKKSTLHIWASPDFTVGDRGGGRESCTSTALQHMWLVGIDDLFKGIWCSVPDRGASIGIQKVQAKDALVFCVSNPQLLRNHQR